MSLNGNLKPEGDHIGTRETGGDGRFNTPLRQDHSALSTKPVFFHPF